MSCNGDEECDIRPGTVTPKKLPKQSGGGGHEFVTDLPETGDEGVEYVLMDDFSDCSTYRGTFVWNEECGGFIQTSGSGGGAVERYTFEQTATGWRAKRNNTVIFTYVDKDTIDTYENTADGFQIVRDGVVIFTHTDGGSGDCKEYTITSTADGWVFKEDDETKFTYTEPANDPSDGTYFTSGTLTTAITGTTTVAASSVTGLAVADIVIGETLIYDGAGTVGRVTAVSGTNLTVETITTAPGERRGTRLGAVDNYTDLPATCAAATALGWQTPLAGDFAYVREDSTHDNLLTEYVIQNIDDSCNITWGYSHTLNAGNYVLDIYKYGDYPSGSPIAKNPDGSVTLPKDEDTKYDFETIMDGAEVKGWRVKDHDTGTVLYTYTDQNDNDTYTFEDVVVSGNVVGWRVKDADGTVVYTYTDLDDKSDGTYFTSGTLDTDITDQTTIALSTVSGLTASDIVIGETLIYDADGTVGVVTAVSGTDLTVDTITVSGSGDASSFVYHTAETLDNTVDNTTVIALADLADSSANVPTASDIIIGKTLVWDTDGTVALAVAISGSDVTFKTMTVSGGGGSITYLVDKNGDRLKSAYAKLDANFNPSVGAIFPLVKKSGDFEQPSVGLFTIPDGMRIEAIISTSQYPRGDISFAFYNSTDGAQLPNISASDPYVDGTYLNATDLHCQWTNDTGHAVNLSVRVTGVSRNGTFTHLTHFTLKEIGRVVDPVKYLDNSEGLQDTPVGNIISYMGNNVPRHYLACDGTIYNIGDYPALEAHFVEEFGRVNYFGGNGTTTWAVPDLQGEFLRGTGTNSHANQGNGANVGAHQDATTMAQYAVDAAPANAVFAYQNGSNNDNTNNADFSAPSTRRIRMSGTIESATDRPAAVTSRPTNTSVKYCIKYESTMQVILGADQYAVRGTFARNTANSVWQINKLTATDGDTSLVDSNGVFHAPESGYYQLTANTGWTLGRSLWMTWQRQATAIVGNTQAVTNANMLLNNTGAPGNPSNDNGISREVLSGAVWLNKGDPVTLQTYTQGYPDANGKYEWSIVRLTGSVDINEVNIITADDVYTYEEQLVGSYLGKPLYKRTVAHTISTATANVFSYSTISANVDKDCIVKYKGRITNADDGNTVAGIPCYYTPQACADCWFSTDGIHIYTGTQYGKPGNICEVTYYYTKTTDTAGSAPNKNSLLLTRPDLWTPGTEYDFGGGLYGQRFKGTTPASSLSSGGIVLVTGVAKTAQVKSKGGMVDMSGTAGTNWYDINGGWSPASSGTPFYPLVTNTSQVLRFYCANNQGYTSQTVQYDIWITYTKA